jgi:thiamine-monophosphate kinase
VTRSIPLGPGAEFDTIRALIERWGDRAAGIGDDAAMLPLTRGDLLVTSVDAAIENRHFRREWLSPREIGYRAVAAALSDLAAMAARPLGILIAFALPDAWRNDLGEIADGAGDAVAASGTVIRGGNISASTELSITTTVLGSAFDPLTRTGARPGDRVFVTGRLGGPGAALARLRRGEDSGAFRERFAHPVPRLAEARWLVDRGATAGIDISDGLVADLRHLAAASGVSVAIDAARVPLVAGVGADDALVSGEEYELLVAAREPLDVATFEARFGVPLSEIGTVGDGTKGLVSVHGARVADRAGHDHLSR